MIQFFFIRQIRQIRKQTILFHPIFISSAHNSFTNSSSSITPIRSEFSITLQLQFPLRSSPKLGVRQIELPFTYTANRPLKVAVSWNMDDFELKLGKSGGKKMDEVLYELK